MRRRLRTPLDQLKPSHGQRMRASETMQREEPKLREFVEGERVLTMSFSSRSQCKWLPAVVVKRLGSTNYEVQLESGEKKHRHVDQLLSNEIMARGGSIFGRSGSPAITDDVQPVVERVIEGTPSVVEPVAEELVVREPIADSPAVEEPEVIRSAVEETAAPSPVVMRRSVRERRRPAHLVDYQ